MPFVPVMPTSSSSSAGVPEEALGERRERAPRVGHHDRHGARPGSDGGQRLDEQRGGAEGERLREVVVAVGERAAQRDEEVAGRDLARVVADPAHHRVAVAAPRAAARAAAAGRRAAPRGASEPLGPEARPPARTRSARAAPGSPARIVPGAGSCPTAVPSPTQLDAEPRCRPSRGAPRRGSGPEKSGTSSCSPRLLDAERASRTPRRRRGRARRRGAAGAGGGRRVGAQLRRRGAAGAARRAFRAARSRARSGCRSAASCAAATRAKTARPRRRRRARPWARRSSPR